MVEKALALSGTIVMGLPIMVQLTESERNKLHPGDGLEVTLYIVSVTLAHSYPGISIFLQVLAHLMEPCSETTFVASLEQYLTSFKGYMLVLCISISRKAISNRSLNPSGSSSLLTSTEIQ